jgi:hypothetical protein
MIDSCIGFFLFFIPLVHGLNQFKGRRKSQSNPFNFSIQSYPFDLIYFLKNPGWSNQIQFNFFDVKYIVNSFFVVDHIYCQCFPLKILSMIPFFFYHYDTFLFYENKFFIHKIFYKIPNCSILKYFIR